MIGKPLSTEVESPAAYTHARQKQTKKAAPKGDLLDSTR
jgi:hypothetical protein